MKMRKLFAGIAAAVTLLGGMALGAASAQADGPQMTTPLLQVNNAQAGHTYTPYKFATFANAGNGTVEVNTVDAWKTAVTTLLTPPTTILRTAFRRNMPTIRPHTWRRSLRSRSASSPRNWPRPTRCRLLLRMVL